MHRSITRNSSLVALCLAAAVLAACGNLSHKVAADGSGAGELLWPAADSVTPIHRGGTYPNVADVRLIGAGMSKQQVAQLIGPPHYSEGVWGVREWNYLFNFRTAGTDAVTQCQYKILFDQQKLARSFYWQPASCAALLDEPKPAAANTIEKTFTLQTDALFRFDRSDVRSIRPEGGEQLKLLATKILAMPEAGRSIHIAGYTDRIGSDEYNQTLSQKRADTVRQVLQDNGVPADSMDAQGHGKADPVKQCDQRRRTALIACLAPNRRVEVTVQSPSH